MATEAAFSVAATAGGTGTAPTSTAGPAVPPAAVSVFVALLSLLPPPGEAVPLVAIVTPFMLAEVLDATAQAGQSIEVDGASPAVTASISRSPKRCCAEATPAKDNAATA